MNRIPIKSCEAIFLAFMILAVSGCHSAGGQEATRRLTVAVTSSLEQPVAALIDAFNRVNAQGTPFTAKVVPENNLRTALEQGGESAAIQWQAPLSEDWSAQIGWTGILFAVHPDNPVEDLSSSQAQGILLGRIKRWADVGGQDGNIHLIAYSPDHELEDLLEGIVLEGNRLTTDAEIVPSVYAMSAAIESDPESIGFFLSFHTTPGVRILSIDAVAAEYPNIISGKYPLRIPLYLIAQKPVSTEILSFAGWIQSIPGQTLLMELTEKE